MTTFQTLIANTERQIASARGRQEAAETKRAAIRRRLVTENREANADETNELASALADVNEQAVRITELRSRLALMEAEQSHDHDLTRGAQENHAGAPQPNAGRAAGVAVGHGPAVYSPDAEREGTSFLRDVAAATFAGDVAARERLARSSERELDARGMTARSGSTSNYSGIVVPQYLVDLVAPKARAGRPLADLATRHQLPDRGMTVNISRITTGASVAVQAAELDTVSETDIDDTILTVPVVTLAGQQTVSRQAVERGDGVDTVIIADLLAAYATELDRQMLYGTGANGQHQGLSALSGLTNVTYTDASPTASELYPKLFDLVQQAQSAVFGGLTHFVMHPRRWWWLASAVNSAGSPFLRVAGMPTAQSGEVQAPAYGGLVGYLGPVPVVADANIATNKGGGTNEDEVYGITADELHLWEDPSAPVMIRAEQPSANKLGLTFVVYGYSAFTGGRYPAAQGRISGTGLATPTY